MKSVGNPKSVCRKSSRTAVDPFIALNDPALSAELQSSGTRSRRAFNRLVHLALPLLRAKARKSLSDPEEAEEVISQTLMAIAKGMGSFRGESRLTTWIYGVLQNKICDHVGQLQRIRKGTQVLAEAVTEWTDRPQCPSPTCWDSSPDARLDHLRIRDWMRESLEQLSDIDAEAWTLREMEGLTTEAAAARLGITCDAFRVRVFRARQRMATLVKARFQGLHLVTTAPIPTSVGVTGLLRAA